jgi:hypothetical protein
VAFSRHRRRELFLCAKSLVWANFCPYTKYLKEKKNHIEGSFFFIYLQFESPFPFIKEKMPSGITLKNSKKKKKKKAS